MRTGAKIGLFWQKKLGLVCTRRPERDTCFTDKVKRVGRILTPLQLFGAPDKKAGNFFYVGKVLKFEILIIENPLHTLIRISISWLYKVLY